MEARVNNEHHLFRLKAEVCIEHRKWTLLSAAVQLEEELTTEAVRMSAAVQLEEELTTEAVPLIALWQRTIELILSHAIRFCGSLGRRVVNTRIIR
eukprot:5624594-Amphidinium_carterae.1